MPAGAISHPANALDSTPLSGNFDQYHLTNPRGAISNVFSIIDFASVGQRSADFQLVWELRTVNQRFLETTFGFLEALKGIEQSLRVCKTGTNARQAGRQPETGSQQSRSQIYRKRTAARGTAGRGHRDWAEGTSNSATVAKSAPGVAWRAASVRDRGKRLSDGGYHTL